jgi:hypothetical protein
MASESDSDEFLQDTPAARRVLSKVAPFPDSDSEDYMPDRSASESEVSNGEDGQEKPRRPPAMRSKRKTNLDSESDKELSYGSSIRRKLFLPESSDRKLQVSDWSRRQQSPVVRTSPIMRGFGRPSRPIDRKAERKIASRKRRVVDESTSNAPSDEDIPAQKRYLRHRRLIGGNGDVPPLIKENGKGVLDRDELCRIKERCFSYLGDLGTVRLWMQRSNLFDSKSDITQ